MWERIGSELREGKGRPMINYPHLLPDGERREMSSTPHAGNNIGYEAEKRRRRRTHNKKKSFCECTCNKGPFSPNFPLWCRIEFPFFFNPYLGEYDCAKWKNYVTACWLRFPTERVTTTTMMIIIHRRRWCQADCAEIFRAQLMFPALPAANSNAAGSFSFFERDKTTSFYHVAKRKKMQKYGREQKTSRR